MTGDPSSSDVQREVEVPAEPFILHSVGTISGSAGASPSRNAGTNDDIVIGVDGGGTKTVAWVAPLDDPDNTIVLGCGQAGPCNPRAVGFEVAQRAIDDAVTEALQSAQRPLERVASAWLGIAGAGRESEQRQLQTWALGAGAIAQHVRVSGDAEPILSAATADNWGIALIGGTGSLAWGRTPQGVTARCGGCGYLIGDEGSAYAIAVAALRIAMQSADGRHPQTPILDRMLSYFEATSPSNLIEHVYAPTMTRDRIAGAAPLVFELSDDSAAAAIIAQAATDLAALVLGLVRQLDFTPNSYPLAMTGSLLLQQEPFRCAITERLTSVAPNRVILVKDTVGGAVALARRLAYSRTACEQS